jgi:hypothetical protein
MVVYTFELLPEGGYAPTGVFRSRVKVDDIASQWPRQRLEPHGR